MIHHIDSYTLFKTICLHQSTQTAVAFRPRNYEGRQENNKIPKIVVTQLLNFVNPPVVFVFPKLKFIFLSKEIQIISDNRYIKKGKCSSNLYIHKWSTYKFPIWKITDHNWKQLILVVNFIFGLRVNGIPNQIFIFDSHRTFVCILAQKESHDCDFHCCNPYMYSYVQYISFTRPCKHTDFLWRALH